MVSPLWQSTGLIIVTQCQVALSPVPLVVQGGDRRTLGQFIPDAMPAPKTCQHREVSSVAWLPKSFCVPWASISLRHLWGAETVSKPCSLWTPS